MIQLAVMPPYVHTLLVMGFLLLALLLILVILIQKPQGGGLSGAFGAGASSGQTAFGAKTGDMLTWLTVTIFVLFVLGAIGLNFTTRENPYAPQVTVPAAITGVGGGEVEPGHEGHNHAPGEGHDEPAAGLVGTLANEPVAGEGEGEGGGGEPEAVPGTPENTGAPAGEGGGGG